MLRKGRIVTHSVLIPAIVFALLLGSAHPAHGQEALLHIFSTISNDGVSPESSLIFDSAGNIYGTTASGGQYGYGTVYELLAGTWEENILYSFTGGSDGGNTASNVIFDSKGNLYGTTPVGGAYNGGVLFELSPVGTGWAETVLHSFGGPGDGIGPASGVIMDPKTGNLYGMTGGDYYQTDIPPTVYEVSLSGGSWVESIIYTFPSYDGHFDNVAFSTLTMDAAGNIYGNSSLEVLELSPNGLGGWNPTTLHRFTGPPKDGWDANGTPVLDSAGNLYGATGLGGSKNCGTVYKLSPGKKGKWTEKILYSFACTVGSQPVSGIVLDAELNIYGTLEDGGSLGDGSVYELVAPVGRGAYKEKTLFSFDGWANPPQYKDGAYPLANLIWDSAGNLYGTTAGGGSTGSLINGCGTGCGVVFEVNPSAAATTTTLSSSLNPSIYGEAVTFFAVVAPAPPDGETVTFLDGSTELGTGNLSGGSASLTTSSLAVGTSKITAVYGSDFDFGGSTSNTVKQVVKK